MNTLVPILVCVVIAVALGALIGSAVNKPLAGILLTLSLGPIGWVILFIWSREDQKAEQPSVDTTD